MHEIPSWWKIKGGELPNFPGGLSYENAAERSYTSAKHHLSSAESRLTFNVRKTRIAQMVSEIRHIDYIQKLTAIEALILEDHQILFSAVQHKGQGQQELSISSSRKKIFQNRFWFADPILAMTLGKKYKAVFGRHVAALASRRAGSNPQGVSVVRL